MQDCSMLAKDRSAVQHVCATAAVGAAVASPGCHAAAKDSITADVSKPAADAACTTAVTAVLCTVSQEDPGVTSSVATTGLPANSMGGSITQNTSLSTPVQLIHLLLKEKKQRKAAEQARRAKEMQALATQLSEAKQCAKGLQEKLAAAGALQGLNLDQVTVEQLQQQRQQQLADIECLKMAEKDEAAGVMQQRQQLAELQKKDREQDERLRKVVLEASELLDIDPSVLLQSVQESS